MIVATVHDEHRRGCAVAALLWTALHVALSSPRSCVVPTEVPVIACEDVSKTYFSTSARVEALKGVTVSLPSGITALVGPSGSGKSSLLRILAGLDKPTSGRVLSDGRDITTLSEPRLLALRRAVVGYVFQRPADNLVPHLTVAEHIRLANHLGPGPRAVAHFPRSARAAAATTTGRPPFPAASSNARRSPSRSPPGRASSWPTSRPRKLDRRSVEDLVSLVRDLAALGVTFVIATHDQAVMSIATHVVELDTVSSRRSRTWASGKTSAWLRRSFATRLRDPPPLPF